MIIDKTVKSVCPECLKEIDATIRVSPNGVYMTKTCPDHGDTMAMVEKDPIFYMMFNGLINADNIYDGLMVDITSRCNTKCKYCYYPIGFRPDPTQEEILALCEKHYGIVPFVLFGGEPTVREDLAELAWKIRNIRDFCPVAVCTNGIKMADMNYLKTLDAFIYGDTFMAAISLHPEANNTPGDYKAKVQAIDNIISMGLKLDIILFVMDDITQIDEAIRLRYKHKDHVNDFRLKFATDVWETEGTKQIYNSDSYEYLLQSAKKSGVPFSINHAKHNKLVFFNVLYDGMPMSSVKWYTKHNIDLDDIRDCPPWNLDKEGNLIHVGIQLVIGG